MRRDWTNVSRYGRQLVRVILKHHVEGMVSDEDYWQLERSLLDIIRAERRIALRAPRSARTQEGKP